MLLEAHHFDLFADYFQFYIQDESARGDLSEAWNKDATDCLLAVADSTIGVGTVRNMTVPVDIELHDAAPQSPLEEWDQVNECGIAVTSGRLVVAGCSDYFPDAARINVAPGTYRARIFYGKLDALSEDGLDGEDHYLIQLWPGSLIASTVLKRRSSG